MPRRPAIAFLALLVSCSSSEGVDSSGPDVAPNDMSTDGSGPVAVVPELGTSATRKLTVIGGAGDGLVTPRDLAFAPLHPDQLWVADEKTNGVVIYFDPGTDKQRAEARVDMYARHFMPKVSALAFGVQNRFATCAESRDDWNDKPQPEDDFMGPTLWLADLDIFAKVNQVPPPPPPGKEGSHIDMLHESPWCMGIAWDRDNVYWAADGLHGNIVRYDFVNDHGPGGAGHSDGIVRRYVEAKIKRAPEVPSHLVLDHESGLLYVADAGAGRVMRLDTRGGSVTGTLPKENEPLREYSKVEGAKWEQLASVTQPSGIELAGGRLFVSDHASGAIIAMDLSGKEIDRVETGAKGLMGITLGPDGKLYYVDAAGPSVVRIDP